MTVFVRIASLLIALAAAVLTPISGKLSHSDHREPEKPRGLAGIRSHGMLRVATIRGSGAYFLHRGRPAGLEYDLLSRLGGELGVDTDPHPVASAAEAIYLLHSGEVDLAVVPSGEPPVEDTIRVMRPDAPPGTHQILTARGATDLVSALQDTLERSRRDGYARILEQRYARLAARGTAPTVAGISPWDQLIARHAEAEGFDWRLVAAVISEESSFDPAAVSSVGATGLMQLMPAVGEDHAIDDLADPEANVSTGIRYLRRLTTIFPGPDGDGNLPLVLAAYLLGPGHVLDARQLAREHDLDPERWKGGVRRMLPLLEEPEHYERLRFGYAQGKLAVRYVDRILRRYEIYKRHAARPVELEDEELVEEEEEEAAPVARAPSRTGDGQRPM